MKQEIFMKNGEKLQYLYISNYANHFAQHFDFNFIWMISTSRYVVDQSCR